MSEKKLTNSDSALHYNTTYPLRPTRVQSSPGPRSTSSASSSGTTTPRPATATPTVPPAAPSRPTQPPARQAVQLSDLQNILSNIQGKFLEMNDCKLHFTEIHYR